MDLLSLLRQRTRAGHDRLDAALDFRTPGSVTRCRYVALLRASLGVVPPLEVAISGWLRLPAAPTRISCLSADLRALADAAPDVVAAPVRLPRTLAEAYGCAYVMEGSSLGGLMLASFVTRDLGPRAPVAYLALRGRATRPAWQSFVRDLQAFGVRSSDREHEEAAAIALDTFEAYRASFGRAGLVADFA